MRVVEEHRDEEGRRHREDGPAVVWDDGTEVWYRHGQWHREDGPAVVYSDGSEYWYRHGQRHREDGPAIVWPDGTEVWYLLGTRVKPFNEVELPIRMMEILNGSR